MSEIQDDLTKNQFLNRADRCVIRKLREGRCVTCGKTNDNLPGQRCLKCVAKKCAQYRRRRARKIAQGLLVIRKPGRVGLRPGSLISQYLNVNH